MKSFLLSSWLNFQPLLPAISFSIFGGFLKFIRTQDKESMQFRFFWVCIFTGAFVGVIIYVVLGTLPFEINNSLKIIAAGLSGYKAETVLKIITEKFVRKVDFL